MSELNERERFFYENAGWVVHPGEGLEAARERMARVLAAAEVRFENGPYVCTVFPEDEPWDGDVPWDGPLWSVALWRECSDEGRDLVPLGSVGMVACESDDPDLRVVRAELASQYVPE